MGSKIPTSCLIVCILASVVVNIWFATTSCGLRQQLSWSQKAAAEAEAVAAVSCSGHGRAYLDGVVVEGNAVCECNTCYHGPDCSQFLPDCAADVDSGNPLFLEPFWMQHAASSAVLVAGWHRMSYSFPDQSFISRELEKHIRVVHSVARNAVTKGKYIIFGGGSTQLLAAAVFALSMNSSSPARVVADSPYYPLYKSQTDYFKTVHFEFEGDVSVLLNNSSADTSNVIEFVTSPNNPDGLLKKAVLRGSSVRTIYDHAYYWPHYTAIPEPADEDLMIFTISKLTGHAGSRLGWAFVKDKDVYQRMTTYISQAEMGISKEAQLRALKLMKAILEGEGTEIFRFAHEKMSDRWEKLSETISLSKHFTLQDVPPQFCTFFGKSRGPSPAYAWLRCESEGDTDCNAVLKAANIIGRSGSLFNVEDRYVRLSLLKSDDDFNLLLHRLKDLVSSSNFGVKTM